MSDSQAWQRGTARAARGARGAPLLDAVHALFHHILVDVDQRNLDTRGERVRVRQAKGRTDA